MNTVDANTKLIDSYLSLLRNMSAQNKLDLISKLTKSVKTDIKEDKPDFYKSFGGWDKNESALDIYASEKARL